MRRALVTIALSLFMTRPLIPTDVCEVYKAIERQRFIEENGLEYVYLSCYLATGNCTADGSVPYEGICASNYAHMGMDCIIYNKDLIPVMRLQCRDVGGDSRLVNGTAIDVFRSSYERCLQLREELSDHVYIKWIPREAEGYGENEEN